MSTAAQNAAARPTNGDRAVADRSVGLVHDYLLVMRGAERTFAEIARCWPESPIYTLLYDPAGTDERFADREIHASYAQRIGSRQHNFKRLAPLFPHAVQHLPVSDHNVLISSSSAFAHGITPGPGARHVCYCHSPFRYAWQDGEQTASGVPRIGRPLMRRGLAAFRSWDMRAAEQVDEYIANSEITRERIQDFYGREPYAVIHPPVEVERFWAGEPEDYFLVVGELVGHKRVELALEAAQRAGKRMKVIGVGPDGKRLQAAYGESADFVGRVSDAELAHLYAGALAVVTPNVEEFGIVAVEAQAAGRPVVAANAGGARETVIDGLTGVLVPPDDLTALSEALSEVDFSRFSVPAIQSNASRFSTDVFKARLSEAVARICAAEPARQWAPPAEPARVISGEAPRPRAPVPA